MYVELVDIKAVLIAMLIGLIIGGEREYRNKTAGLRTLMLVSVGSCIFTILSIKIGVANPDRLAANIITGIGFLGAGAIFKDENKISGLTTATTIWVTAALGMCIGFGFTLLGIIGAGVVLIVLWMLLFLEESIDRINRTHIYSITAAYEQGFANKYETIFLSYGLKSRIIGQSKENNNITGSWSVSGSVKQHAKLSKQLLNDSAIHQVTF